MNFIKKIFDKKIDSGIHLQFQKFGRGEFRNKALIRIKKSGNKYSITTSAEFANEFVYFLAQNLKDKRTRVTGAIISTNDLKNDLEFKEIKQFQGVKRYIIDKEMSGEEIIMLLEKFPRAFFALSFSSGEEILKIKPKAPKSSKPGKEKGDAPKADFCKIITSNSEFAKSFVFEKSDFKSAEINHVYIIREIEVPSNLKNSGDFAKMREDAKRKGILVRNSEIDGQKFQKEIEFEA